MTREQTRRDYELMSRVTYLLTVARFSILALGAVNERRGFRVEAVKAIRLLVDESVVLGNELPANFRRIDGGVGHAEGRTLGGRGGQNSRKTRKRKSKTDLETSWKGRPG